MPTAFLKNLWHSLGGLLFLVNGILGQPITQERPHLVVLVVVDQLRAAAVQNWSLSQRAYLFEEAYLNYSCSETAPGHATILSSRLPHAHGIIANSWYDPSSAFSLKTAVLDNQFQTIGGRGPAASPRQFYGSHLSLAWKQRYPQSYFISLSWKDRAAVLLGGPKADLAFWAGNQGFITSTYYTLSEKALPWLQAYNQQFPMSRYASRSWLNGKHKLPSKSDNWAIELAHTPYSDEMTLSFLLYLVQKLNLGKRSEEPDFIAVSFSALDYIAHKYSYTSREVAWQLYSVQKNLASLEKQLRRLLPHRRILFVLTADHGGSLIEEEAKLYGVQPRLLLEKDFTKQIYSALQQKHPYIEKALLFHPPHFYLHYEAIGNPRYSREEILQEARQVIQQQPEVFAVLRLTPANLEVFFNPKETKPNQKIATELLVQLVRNCYFPQRSSDLYVVLQPWIYLQDNERYYMAGHGSPFASDRKVPLLFWGDGIGPGGNKKEVSIHQLAITLAHLAQVPYFPPDGAQELLPGF